MAGITVCRPPVIPVADPPETVAADGTLLDHVTGALAPRLTSETEDPTHTESAPLTVPASGNGLIVSGMEVIT